MTHKILEANTIALRSKFTTFQESKVNLCDQLSDRLFIDSLLLCKELDEEDATRHKDKLAVKFSVTDIGVIHATPEGWRDTNNLAVPKISLKKKEYIYILEPFLIDSTHSNCGR